MIKRWERADGAVNHDDNHPLMKQENTESITFISIQSLMTDCSNKMEAIGVR